MTKDASHAYWQRLLHRWFVEYNPLYLASAGLVLLGAHLWSHDLLASGHLLAQLGVPAITELYAWALIGGAAWLTRIGHCRPAVMLGLLAAFYQCDLTLHTETSVYLGPMGAGAAALWLVSFVAKLFALARALELRLSRSAIAVPTVAALGLVVMPRWLRVLDVDVASGVVAVWLFGVLAAGAWTSRSVAPVGRLDGWGRTVLRRSLRATWSMWAVLCVAHVLFWFSDRGLSAGALVPVALLLTTRWVRRERMVWAIVVATLLACGWWLPAHLAVGASLSAVTLCLHAFGRPSWGAVEHASVPATNAPYRRPSSAAEPPRVAVSWAPPSPASRMRLVAGALVAAYLAAWTFGWSGGPFPEHIIALDVALAVALALHAQNAQSRLPFVALPPIFAHYLVTTRILTAPGTAGGWGMLFVALGFVLLIASLAVSHRLRATAPP